MKTATTYDPLPDSAQLEFHEPPLFGGPRDDDDLDIDITPMIDITFLMLIFFLVASTPDKQTAVVLPSAVHGVAVSQLQSTLFTVGDGGIDIAPLYNADGKVPELQLSDDKEQRDDQVREIVSKGLQEENKDSVVIKADRSVAFREVARVIKSASQVEGVQIHLAVLEND
jgi:biopolymer transport protein ExbD